MVSLVDIKQAAERIGPHIISTPLLYSPTFSEMSGTEVYLKLETMQRAGSFKIRGAMNKVLLHREEIGPEGVIAASAGNHAQGVAVAARTAGVPATIVMPEAAPLTKQEATRHYGAKIVLHGKTLTDSLRYVREKGSGALFVHPFDDPEVIAGQGTVGLEIVRDCPRPDWVLVPVGGGGLISGVAIAVKSLHPEARVLGVQASASPGTYRAYYTGTREELEPGESIADGIVVKQAGEVTLPLIRQFVDGILLVEEEQIADAMLLLLERKKVIAEGAGATPLAALLSGTLPVPEGSTVVLVISGGNVDSTLLSRIIRRGLLKRGRILRISVCLRDVPGTLADLVGDIGRLGGNILQINHVRGGPSIPLLTTRVDLEIETKGTDHSREISETLARNYRLLVR